MIKHNYARGRNHAIVTGPIKCSGTHGAKRGIVVTLYQVMINGQRVFHAPAKHIAIDWLKRHGYRRVA